MGRSEERTFVFRLQWNEAFYLERKALVLKKSLLIVFLTMHTFPNP